MSEEIIKRLEKIEERLNSIEGRILPPDPYRHCTTDAPSYMPFLPWGAPRPPDFDRRAGYKVGKKYRIKEGWQGKGMNNEHLGKIYTLSFVGYPPPPTCSDATLVFEFDKKDNPELEEDLRFYNDMTDIELVEEEK